MDGNVTMSHIADMQIIILNREIEINDEVIITLANVFIPLFLPCPCPECTIEKAHQFHLHSLIIESGDDEEESFALIRDNEYGSNLCSVKDCCAYKKIKINSQETEDKKTDLYEFIKLNGDKVTDQKNIEEFFGQNKLAAHCLIYRKISNPSYLV